MPAAVAVGGRQAARKRFEQGVRAGVVAARRDVDVLRPEQVGERGRIERPDDAEALERGAAAGPANVSSKRSGSRFRSSHASVSAPLRGLSDQLLATSRTRLPSSGSRPAGGWKIAGSTAFGMTAGSRSSKPSSRCFASENSDWKIVADASAALTSAIRASVPSSNPRYAPIGPSTRCTIRAPDARSAAAAGSRS